MTHEELREKVARAIHEAMRFDRENYTPAWQSGNSRAEDEARGTADAVIAVVLEEAASLKFLRPLVEKQSLGEWNDKTIDEDVAMFAAAIRALGKP